MIVYGPLRFIRAGLFLCLHTLHIRSVYAEKRLHIMQKSHILCSRVYILEYIVYLL